MKHKRFFALGAVLIFVVGTAFFSPKQLVNKEKESAILEAVLTFLDRMHFQPQTIDDDFSDKLYDTYLKRIDGLKRFLTQEDLNQLSAYKDLLDDQTNARSFEFFELSIALLEEGIEKAKLDYREILDQPFDFEKKEEYELDGEKRDYAANNKELKDYWRNLLKYQTLEKLRGKIEAQEDKSEEEGAEIAVDKSFDELEQEARNDVQELFNDWFSNIAKIKRSDRFEVYLNTITNIYDPHTTYYNPKEKEDFDINMSGKLEGIGARLSQDGEYTKVVSIVPGGPAYKQGELQVDDLIIRVQQEDGEPKDVVGMVVSDVVTYIRGKKDTKVILSVKKVDGTTQDIMIVRDEVILDDGRAQSFILDHENIPGKKIGYIRLPRFYADFDNKDRHSCATDIENEVAKLKEEAVDGIVLDLRNNGGGSLADAVRMTGLFIEDGPIVQVKGKSSSPYVFEDQDPSIQYSGPMVVMVNSFSASASEILAAALQDYKRAVIVGSASTYGKATVQKFYNLDKAIRGNADLKPLGDVKLTTQKFYRISGGSNQLQGVKPDIVLPDNYQFIDIGEKENDYPLTWSSIEKLDFQNNVNTVGQLANLKMSSQRRIASHKGFNLINQNAKRLEAMREESKYPLDYDSYVSKINLQDDEAKKYKEIMESPIESLSVSNLKKDERALESLLEEEKENKMDKNKAMIEGLSKDIYLEEVMFIMRDMMK